MTLLPNSRTVHDSGKNVWLERKQREDFLGSSELCMAQGSAEAAVADLAEPLIPHRVRDAKPRRTAIQPRSPN